MASAAAGGTAATCAYSCVPAVVHAPTLAQSAQLVALGFALAVAAVLVCYAIIWSAGLTLRFVPKKLDGGGVHVHGVPGGVHGVHVHGVPGGHGVHHGHGVHGGVLHGSGGGHFFGHQ